MFKKLTAFVMALCVIGGTALYAPEKPLNIITASAADYTRTKDGSLTFYVYADYAEVYKCNTSAEGEIIIPAEINGVPVTSIGAETFEFCRNITSISIPDSVTDIGNDAFYECVNLTSINIPESVTNIGTYAFHGCTGLTSIIIPDGITNIGECTFYNCSGLTSISIPDSVTSIEISAFRDCKSLTSISIPDSVTSIGNWAFRDCNSLISINIPDRVTSIEDWVFSDCTGLTSISIPDSVTSIGNSAFSGCENLTSINIPDSVTSIGKFAFSFCTGLTSINIPDSVTSIGKFAFSFCTGLTSINIPDSVTSIGEGAFVGCKSLTEITILNPECEIYDASLTISTTSESVESADPTNQTFPTEIGEFDGTIHGYANSTAQAYAEKYGYKFAVIGDEAPAEYLAGDANLDGKTSISDAVRILQYVSNKEKYNLSGQALENADVYNKGDGITGMDAASIQRLDAGVIDSLPESVMEK